MLIDTHFHLDPEDDPGALLAAAQAAGVRRLVLAGAPVGRMGPWLERIAPHPAISAAVGVHPHEAANFDGDLAPYRAWSARPGVVAIGEVGLDYHYHHSPPAVQRQVFGAFLGLARERDLPVIVHCREAYDDTERLLRDELGGRHPFVVHCFSGTPAWAERFLALGGCLSYTGLITFPKADNVRESLRVTPTDRLFFETDSPFLAPVPHRGKRNQPAFLPYIVARAAQELGLSTDELTRRAADTAAAFFRFPSDPAAPV